MKIDCIDLYQANDERSGYKQSLWIHRGEKCRNYFTQKPARFARFLQIVMAFAERNESMVQDA